MTMSTVSSLDHLRSRVLEELARHPDGITSADLATAMGINIHRSPKEAGHVTSLLVIAANKGKARRVADRAHSHPRYLFFPASTSV